jgi:hypothetical protein
MDNIVDFPAEQAPDLTPELLRMEVAQLRAENSALSSASE